MPPGSREVLCSLSKAQEPLCSITLAVPGELRGQQVSLHPAPPVPRPLPGSRDGGDVFWPTKAPHRVTEGTVWGWAVLREHPAGQWWLFAAAPRWKCLSNTTSSSWHWSPGKRSQALPTSALVLGLQPGRGSIPELCLTTNHRLPVNHKPSPSSEPQTIPDL